MSTEWKREKTENKVQFEIEIESKRKGNRSSKRNIRIEYQECG